MQQAGKSWEATGKSVIFRVECNSFGLQVLSAVTHIHANGIIHLDIKSQNIMPCTQPNESMCCFEFQFSVTPRSKVDARLGDESPIFARGWQQGNRPDPVCNAFQP